MTLPESATYAPESANRSDNESPEANNSLGRHKDRESDQGTSRKGPSRSVPIGEQSMTRTKPEATRKYKADYC